MIPARQSTAKTIMIGPVLDADGVAVTDGVVADFEVSKNGADPAALDGAATLTHRNTGHYSLALAANDVDTVGMAQIVINDTVNACAPVTLVVIEEAVYDALYAAAANGVPAAGATASALATAQADLDILTGTDGATLATSQPNYAPATAAQATAIEADTQDLQTQIGTAGAGLTSIPKAGYKLASDGLDVIDATIPSAVATTFPGFIKQLWARFMYKSTLSSTELITYASDGTTVVTTQTVSDTGTIQTQGKAS